MCKYMFIAIPVILAAVPTEANELRYKEMLINVLIKHVPGILRTYDAETGRFGEGIWICQDQNLMYPLAVAYAYKSPENSYYKDRDLLEVIMKAGDALIDDMDENGRWEFRKKDGSKWGPTWMPWTYSRWIRSYELIHEDMPPDRRDAWVKALTLGYTGISRSQLGRVHNIPAHHAMGLYIAGKVLNRPEWCEQASNFMVKAAGEQAEGGYWSENIGPVVSYNFVYIDALGTYYALTHDERVLPTLERSANFHYHFTYPNGESVETVDERNPYHKGVGTGNVGFTFTPIGRAYLQRQWSIYGMDRLSSDLIASLLLYGQEGSIPEVESEQQFILAEDGEDKAVTVKSGPWFVCLSAYTAPIPKSRWIQDRQNLVSIFHEKTGLILGGGNTKLQPCWSNFTVGDMALLKHQPGDTDPDFIPKGELYHVPASASLVYKPDVGLDLKYGPGDCRVRIRFVDSRTLEYVIGSKAASGLPVVAHLTLISHPGETLETAGEQEITLGESPITLTAEQLGGILTHGGYRLHLPEGATLHWPALPHNPYRKDGRATPSEGRIEIRIPLNADSNEHTIGLEILSE